jgi:hypothetical protein
MDYRPVENISAQLFNKQLPFDEKTTYTGCDSRVYPGPQYMTTCVDPFDSDARIEDAFQKQLNLSEYYKSPEVFETVKKTFMDETGDYPKITSPNKDAEKIPGYYSKQKFGAMKDSDSDNKMIYYILGLALILILLK